MRRVMMALMVSFGLLFAGGAMSGVGATGMSALVPNEVQTKECYGCSQRQTILDYAFNFPHIGVTATYHEPFWRGNSGGYTFSTPGRGSSGVPFRR